MNNPLEKIEATPEHVRRYVLQSFLMLYLKADDLDGPEGWMLLEEWTGIVFTKEELLAVLLERIL